MEFESETFPPPEDAPADVDDGYTLRELQRNRRWNIVLSAAIISGSWFSFYFGVMSREQAIAATVLTLIVATLYRWLFASKSSVKLDKDGPGMGKKVHPRTMGGILGYLNDGFKDIY